MKIEPRPAAPSELMMLNTTRVPDTDWTSVMDGQWWLVHESEIDDPELNMRHFMRIKMSTGRWAKRCGYARSLRRKSHGMKIWVRFEREGTDG
jgi:hypothetical protein